jgi:hypothetical protein
MSFLGETRRESPGGYLSMPSPTNPTFIYSTVHSNITYTYSKYADLLRFNNDMVDEVTDEVVKVFTVSAIAHLVAMFAVETNASIKITSSLGAFTVFEADVHQFPFTEFPSDQIPVYAMMLDGFDIVVTSHSRIHTFSLCLEWTFSDSHCSSGTMPGYGPNGMLAFNGYARPDNQKTRDIMQWYVRSLPQDLQLQKFHSR